MRASQLTMLCGVLATFGQAQIKLGAPEQLFADNGPIDTSKWVGHSGPLFADLDGDGKKDLLVGTFAGTIEVFANVGTAKAPKFTAKGLLQADGKDIDIHNW
ncbi:MAG: hypothetical protein IPK26_01820 [Planctomycetes bacterium]|nr:hypothetical protein [Planctomycetota bacterium]